MGQGIPFHPKFLPLRSPYVSATSPGFRPLQIIDGFYVATNGAATADEPRWVRIAGHLEGS